MGKTTENTEQTPASAELALLEAQEKMAQMEAELKAANEARAEAEQQAEVAKIEAEAVKAKMEATKSKNVNAMKPTEERVRIKLFKDTKDYKDDLVVVVNGKAYQIQRGVEVEVPKSVAEIIEHSAEQDAKTAQLIESLVADTAQQEREMK